MRTRACVLLLATVLLALTGCSREAGPTAKGSRDPGPGALAVKIRALQNDDCYLAPAQVQGPDCKKYITQLSNVPGNTLKYAQGHPALAEAAKTLEKTLVAYRNNDCAGASAGGVGGTGDADVCTASLNDAATALTTLSDELSTLPDVT